MKKLLFFIFGVFLAALLIAPFAHAQSLAGLSHINRIILGTPGISTVGISGGAVAATAVGDVAVTTAAGLSIPVATSVTATVGAAAIAAGAAKFAFRAVPWVGAGIVVNDIYDRVKDSGYTICPAPDFFCKPPDGYKEGYYFNVDGSVNKSASAACSAFAARFSGWSFVSASVSDVSLTCNLKQSNGSPYVKLGSANLCPTNPTVCSASPSPVPVPATPIDLNQELAKKFAADQAFAKSLYDKIKEVEQANPSLPKAIDVSTAPLTVSAPPVTSPSKVVSTETVPNADGTTSTKTTSQTTTVSPTVGANPTVGNPQITYPSQTTSTTTTINNTTNQTSVSTNTTNNNSPAPVAEPLQLPDDYNRESTQKQIADELEGKTAPATPTDQSERTKTEIGKTDTSLKDLFDGLPNKFTADKDNWFSWVWTPPVGTCNSSDYSGTVRSYTVNWDICPTVYKVRDLLGWLFAIFGAYLVYGQIFKGSKES